MAYSRTEAPKSKREQLTDAELEAICVDALKTSLGAPDSDVGKARLRNLEYYNAEATGELGPPEVEDRSDFVATDVADTVEGMLPDFLSMFAAGDAVEFSATKAGGDQVAKLATAYINYLFMVRNDGVEILYDWFKDALLQKVGFIKVWAEEEAEDSKQTFEGQTEEQLVMLLQDGYELAGEPEVDEQGLTFTVTKDEKRVCIKVAVCAPHEVRVDANARWGDEPAMIAHVFRKRRFELEEDGYDLSDVGQSSVSTSEMEGLSMLGELDSDAYNEPHDSHGLLTVAETYIKLDRDGDGVAEWLKVCLIEDKLGIVDGKPAIEQVDDHPFVWICPIPRPHAFYGDCPADLAIGAQKLRTNIVRAIQDNLYLSVNQRNAIDQGRVNLGDYLDNRPGGAVRVDGDPSTAIRPIVQPNLSAPAYEFNAFITDWSANRTGWNRYAQGDDASGMNKTKGGMEMLTDRADRRVRLMARFFGLGVRKMCLKILKLSVRHQDRQEQFEVNGEWVAVNPSEWRDQFNVKVKVGLGNGTKEQQAARIMGLMQILQPGIASGVVRPQHIAEAIRLYVEANEFKNPERFVDPEPSGMPPNPEAYNAEKQQVAEQMQGLQEQLQQASQENGQLKQAAEMAKLEAKHDEVQSAIKTADAELGAREDALAHMAEGVHRQRETNEQRAAEGEQAALPELQQQVAMLTDAVVQIMQLIQQSEMMQAQEAPQPEPMEMAPPMQMPPEMQPGMEPPL